MNEFTKDELILMYYNFAETEFRGTNAKLETIRTKIQSMIENYCEHEFDMTDWVNDSSGCRWYECKKCEGRYR